MEQIFMNTGEKRLSNPSMAAKVLYVAATLVALMGLILLIVQIYMYTTSVAQYVAQGYPKSEVTKQLLLSMLLPGIFEPLGVYGGIALALFYIGVINKKLSGHPTTVKASDIADENADSIEAPNTVVVDEGMAEAPVSPEGDPVNTNP